MKNLYYAIFSSPFDTFTIVWKEMELDLKLQRIFLSDPGKKSEDKILKFFKKINSGSSTLITEIADTIQRFLEGEDIFFDLKLLDFTLCTETQEKVLKAEYHIPRGWISTYKRIANHVGIKNGARVVGNSLARNPFPIIIPCHRAIKSNGELGGYQGGTKMKRKLLELEGIEISDTGKVNTDRIYY